MNVKHIKLGKFYTNARGVVRRVIAEGPLYKLYDSQTDSDCLRYRVVFTTKGANVRVGDARNCTRVSFAAWARHEVDDPTLTADPRSSERRQDISHAVAIQLGTVLPEEQRTSDDRRHS